MAAAAALGDPEELAAVQVTPGFQPYLFAVSKLWRARGNDGQVLSSAQWDLGRFVAGLWVLYLHATPGGMTTARLSQLMKVAGVAGFGRTRALIIYLRFLRFIEPGPPAGDARLRRYLPTASMAAAYRNRCRRDLEFAAQFDPAIAEGAGRLDDPDYFAAYMAALGEFGLASFLKLDGEAVSLSVLSHRYGGMVVMSELAGAAAAAAGRDDAWPVGEAAYTLAGLANASGISRAQVRDIIRAGVRAGFFEPRGDGRLALTPLLRDHVVHMATCSVIMFRWASKQALAALAAQEQRLSA